MACQSIRFVRWWHETSPHGKRDRSKLSCSREHISIHGRWFHYAIYVTSNANLLSSTLFFLRVDLKRNYILTKSCWYFRMFPHESVLHFVQLSNVSCVYLVICAFHIFKMATCLFAYLTLFLILISQDVQICAAEAPGK